MHRIEGMFSGNVLNGLACETLVVSDRVSSLEKFLGECILLVDGGKDSKEKISEILSNDKKRKEMIEIGKEKIKEFTFDRRVEDLVKFI
jgi:spore maturation protein CgeB